MNKFYSLLAAGLLSATQAGAQYGTDHTKDYYTGATIGEVAVTTFDINTSTDEPHKDCVLLYNVGAKAVMGIGGEWGTQAIVGESGCRVWVQSKEIAIPTKSNSFDVSSGEPTGESDSYTLKTAYYIQTIIQSVQGNAMGYIRNNGKTWLDRHPTGSVTSGDVYVTWLFEPVAEEVPGNDEALNSYYIKPARKRNGTTVSAPETADKYLYVNENGELTMGTPSDMSYAEWRLLTPAKVKAIMQHTFADGETPSDATIYILDWNFSSHNKCVKYWKWMPEGGTSVTVSEGKGDGYNVGAYDAAGKDMTGESDGGKKTCASITTRGTFYQEVSVPRTGWYRVDCQGFGDNNAELFAYEGTLGSANDTHEITLKNNFTMLKANNGTGYSTYEAGGDFVEDKYANHILIYVEVPEGEEYATITLGVRTTADIESGKAVCFDNFQLMYMGGEETETVLDQEDTDATRIEALVPNRLYNIHIHYTPRLNSWNAITLPVSLTKEQFQTMFDNPTLSELHSYTIDGERIVHFQTIDVFGKQAKDIVMEAGKSYLINMSKEPYMEDQIFRPWYPNEDQTELVQSEKADTAKAPYYTIPGVYLKSVDGITQTKTDDSVTSSDGETFYFKGALWKQTITDPLYYALNAGEWYRFTKNMKTKGFRAWLTQTPDASGEAKSFSVYIDGVEDDELTSIFAPQTTADEQPDSRGIYDLNGRRMDARSTKELPRGIYIVNGRKYIK